MSLNQQTQPIFSIERNVKDEETQEDITSIQKNSCTRTGKVNYIAKIYQFASEEEANITLLPIKPFTAHNWIIR